MYALVYNEGGAALWYTHSGAPPDVLVQSKRGEWWLVQVYKIKMKVVVHLC